MNIILGASGQVGSHIVNELESNGLPLRAVLRNPEKIRNKHVAYRTADLFDQEQLINALEGGTVVFLFTPENPGSNDIIGDTERLIENYLRAIEAAGIKKIIALSSIGADIDGNTGNLRMSRMLEQAVDGIKGEKVIVRPSYFYSNWLAFLKPVKQYGILPTFFPGHLKVEMNSPVSVAEFIAEIMINDSFSGDKKIFELVGPQKYNAIEVAETFSKLSGKPVKAQPIPREQWKETLLSAGFTANTAENLSDMTQAVVDKRTIAQYPDRVVTLPVTLEEYLEKQAPSLRGE